MMLLKMLTGFAILILLMNAVTWIADITPEWVAALAFIAMCTVCLRAIWRLIVGK